MTKYVKSIKFSTSGETYVIRDAEQKSRLDTLEPVVEGKQDTLVSGENIKTINNQSILGSGNIEIGGGSGAVDSVNGKTGTVVLNASDVGAASETDLTTHTSNTTVHVTSAEKEEWSGKQDKLTSENAGDNVIISEVGGVVKISSTGGGSGSANWGSIGGTLSDQTDLKNALDAKLESGDLKTINNESLAGSGNIELLTSTEGHITVTPNRSEGGFVDGTTYTNLSFQEFAETLLCPYQAPTATLSVSPTTYHKGGTTNVTASMTATKKSKPLTSATLQVGSGTATSVASLIPNGGSASQTANNISATTTFTFVIGDGQQTVTKTATISFNDYRYHGLVDVAPADVTETVVHTLTTDLTAKKDYSYTGITMTNRRVCYAYPASYGNLSSIKDKNGYEVIGSYTKTTKTVDGVSYNIYTMTSTGSLSNGSMQFS